ncbi:MAG: hypothetical protein HOP96_04305 [Sphingomonas sp.]|nr:hypothetical protein [Sphingomonas sp.]
MAHRLSALTALCVVSAFATSPVLAKPVTTDSCLARGLCAYVSPHGRVTCAPCPGQVKAVSVPRGAKAVCKDGTFSLLKTTTPAKMCVGRGGVGALLKP